MLALKIVGGVLLFLLLLALLPLRLHLIFDRELRIRAGYGPVMVTIFPPKEKKQRKNTGGKQRKRTKKAAGETGHKKAGRLSRLLKEDGVSAVIRYLKMLASLVVEGARGLARITVIDRLFLEIRVAGEDAAQTAVDYGKVCAAVYPALALVESVMRVRQKEVSVHPDFMAEKGTVCFDLKAHAALLPALLLGLRLIMRLAVHTTDSEQSAGASASVKEGKEG
ncbi:MAG: DUF2953 domain-containing protein [Clostridiales bacterium]|nr:DUF2953 domain-containing protein [Clostridiales bacterium]